MSDMIRPLEGIKVVELGTHVAVPNCTRLMADYGAEVIKIESAGGDQWRVVGQNQMCPVKDDETPFFTFQNANKELTSINYKKPEGMEFLQKLLERADVFVTNVRLKSLQKSGLDYESLKEKYPKLIFAHFTGYGYNGPDAWRPGFDSVAFWARSGAMVDWNDVGAYPFLPPSGTGDATCAAQMCAGILSAIIGREKTGKGTFLSLSLIGTATWYFGNGVISSQYGNEYPKAKDIPGTPFGAPYVCSDGEWVMVGVADYAGTYPRLMTAIGLGEYADDDRYKTIQAVKKNYDTFMPLLRNQFTKKTRDEWVKIMEDINVICGPVKHMGDLANDPQTIANDYVRDVTFPTGTTIKMPTAPVQFLDNYAPKADYKVAGAVGRDTDEILKKLGYDDDAIKNLHEIGAVK